MTLKTLTKKQRAALLDAQVLNYMNEAFDILEEYPFKAVENLQSARAILEFEFLVGDIGRNEYLIDDYLYDLIQNIYREKGKGKKK